MSLRGWDEGGHWGTEAEGEDYKNEVTQHPSAVTQMSPSGGTECGNRPHSALPLQLSFRCSLDCVCKGDPATNHTPAPHSLHLCEGAKNQNIQLNRPWVRFVFMTTWLKTASVMTISTSGQSSPPLCCRIHTRLTSQHCRVLRTRVDRVPTLISLSTSVPPIFFGGGMLRLELGVLIMLGN